MKGRFEHLVDAHGGRLLQLAGLMLRSQAEAEDVVQEALVKLWHHLSALTEGQELPWLITCTRNACLDRLRTAHRRSTLVQQMDQALAPESPFEAPDEHHVQNRRARQLYAAIAALPEPGRSLLILRDIQDLDVASGACALCLSENQVTVYNFRARRALRRALEDSAQFEEVPNEQFA